VDRIRTWQSCVDSNVGYSDHTRGLAAADYAYRLGASIVEKHVTLTPGAGGDHDFAIAPGAVRRLVDTEVRPDVVGDALVAGSREIRVHDCELQARHGARRSVVVLVDIPAGDILTHVNVGALRPGGGMQPKLMDDVLGQTAQRFIKAGTQLDDCVAYRA